MYNVIGLNNENRYVLFEGKMLINLLCTWAKKMICALHKTLILYLLTQLHFVGNMGNKKKLNAHKTMSYIVIKSFNSM